MARMRQMYDALTGLRCHLERHQATAPTIDIGGRCSPKDCIEIVRVAGLDWSFAMGCVFRRCVSALPSVARSCPGEFQPSPHEHPGAQSEAAAVGCGYVCGDVG